MRKQIIACCMMTALLLSGCATSKSAPEATTSTQTMLQSNVNMNTKEILKLSDTNYKTNCTLPNDVGKVLPKDAPQKPKESEEDFAKYVDEMIAPIPYHKPVKRDVVKDKDIILVTFNETIDGEPSQMNFDEDEPVYVEVNGEAKVYFPEDTSKEFIGKHVGDSYEITYKYPKEEESAYAGKTSVMTGTVKGIYKDIPMTYKTLTDDYVKQNFGEDSFYNVSTVDAFLEAVKKEYSQSVKNDYETALYTFAIQDLMERSSIAISQDLKKKTIKKMEAEMTEIAKSNDMTLEEYLEESRKQGEEMLKTTTDEEERKEIVNFIKNSSIEAMAENEIKFDTVADALIEKYEIVIEEKDFDRFIDRYNGGQYTSIDDFYKDYGGKDTAVITYARELAMEKYCKLLEALAEK